MNRKPVHLPGKRPVFWTSILLAGVFILSACQPAAPAATPAPAATAAVAATQVPAVTQAPAATEAPAITTAPAATAELPATGGEATIHVATDPTLGPILVDGNGMTLYMFAKDTPNQSNCTGKCLQSWPPLATQGNPTLGEGVDDSLVGTATLADGSKMVTYNQMPLYTFAKDEKPGDVTGQGANDVWYVVSPDGAAVGYGGAATEAPAATTAPASTEAPAATSAPAAASEATINVATDPSLGPILVDGNGMTLYMYAKDGPDQTNCTGKCLEFWPALITQGNPTLGEGVDDSLVGTATMADGTKMVTYNHMPLYTFSDDGKPGDVTGQGNRNVWYVVSPDGVAVGYAGAAPQAPAPTSAPAYNYNP